MIKFALHFLATLVLYAIFDLSWLNLFAKGFIERQVGHFLAPRPDLVAALVFYLIFTAGLMYFCIYPAKNQQIAFLNGAFFGLVTYSTYELVNKALLDRWPAMLVVVDITWGVIVGALVTGLSYNLMTRMGWR